MAHHRNQKKDQEGQADPTDLYRLLQCLLPLSFSAVFFVDLRCYRKLCMHCAGFCCLTEACALQLAVTQSPICADSDVPLFDQNLKNFEAVACM